MTIPFWYLRSAALIMVLAGAGTSTVYSQSSEQSAVQYRDVVRPFLQQHCGNVTDLKTAKAGYRITDSGRTSRSAGRGAVERSHRSRQRGRDAAGRGSSSRRSTGCRADNVGQPPCARTGTRRATGRRAYLPVRRLNRDEFANTVRDLLKLDPRIACR